MQIRELGFRGVDVSPARITMGRALCVGHYCKQTAGADWMIFVSGAQREVWSETPGVMESWQWTRVDSSGV